MTQALESHILSGRGCLHGHHDLGVNHVRTHSIAYLLENFWSTFFSNDGPQFLVAHTLKRVPIAIYFGLKFSMIPNQTHASRPRYEGLIKNISSLY